MAELVAARQIDPEHRARADLAFSKDVAAGLLDDAVHRGQAKPCPLADLLGGEERIENLVDDLRRDARAGVGDFDQHVVGGRHALVAIRRAFLRGDVGGAHRELAAIRHGVARVDREIDDHLLELGDVGLHRPQVAAEHGFQLNLLADQTAQQHVELGNHVIEIEHLGPQRLPPRKRQQLPHQARRPVGVLLDLHDVLKGRIGRLVRVEQEVGRHHDGR